MVVFCDREPLCVRLEHLWAKVASVLGAKMGVGFINTGDYVAWAQRLGLKRYPGVVLVKSNRYISMQARVTSDVSVINWALVAERAPAKRWKPLPSAPGALMRVAFIAINEMQQVGDVIVSRPRSAALLAAFGAIFGFLMGAAFMTPKYIRSLSDPGAARGLPLAKKDVPPPPSSSSSDDSSSGDGKSDTSSRTSASSSDADTNPELVDPNIESIPKDAAASAEANDDSNSDTTDPLL